MRVGLLVYALDRPLTGIGRYTTELVRALLALPDCPEIVLLMSGGPGPLAAFNLPQVRLPGARLLPGLLTLGNLYIPYLAHRHKLDVVHDLSGITPFVLGAGRAKRVTTLYDLIPLAFPGLSTRLDSLIYRRWLPFTLPRVDGVVTISEASRADLQRFMKVAPEKVWNVSGGVGPQYQPASAERIARVRQQHSIGDAPYFLFVGSVQERKNVRRSLLAFAELCKRGLPHHFVIVGAKQWKYEEILNTLTSLEVKDRIHFTGYVDEADLPALYTGAAAFVFPSLYEGFGLPVLESLACGTPAVTSTVSSLPEVAGDAAPMVDPLDVDALADALYRLATDVTLHAALRQKGLAHVRQFTWAQTAQRVLTAYRAVLDSGS
jgi:glycosyltransferase involved in cell wall biosynthesis